MSAVPLPAIIIFAVAAAILLLRRVDWRFLGIVLDSDVSASAIGHYACLRFSLRRLICVHVPAAAVEFVAQLFRCRALLMGAPGMIG